MLQRVTHEYKHSASQKPQEYRITEDLTSQLISLTLECSFPNNQPTRIAKLNSPKFSSSRVLGQLPHFRLDKSSHARWLITRPGKHNARLSALSPAFVKRLCNETVPRPPPDSSLYGAMLREFALPSGYTSVTVAGSLYHLRLFNFHSCHVAFKLGIVIYSVTGHVDSVSF